MPCSKDGPNPPRMGSWIGRHQYYLEVAIEQQVRLRGYSRVQPTMSVGGSLTQQEVMYCLG